MSALKNDGQFKFYQIQTLYAGGASGFAEWQLNTYPYSDPVEAGFSIQDGLNSLGDVWKQTGQSGTFNFEYARHACKYAADHFPEHAHRLVTVHVVQTRHVVVTYAQWQNYSGPNKERRAG